MTELKEISYGRINPFLVEVHIGHFAVGFVADHAVVDVAADVVADDYVDGSADGSAGDFVGDFVGYSGFDDFG